MKPVIVSAVSWPTALAGLTAMLAAFIALYFAGFSATVSIACLIAAAGASMYFLEFNRYQLSVRWVCRGPVVRQRVVALAVAALPWLAVLGFYQSFYPVAVAALVDMLVLFWPVLLIAILLSILRVRANDTLSVLSISGPDWSSREALTRLRDLLVKAVFLPLMLGFLFGWWRTLSSLGVGPHAWFLFTLAMFYLADLIFASVGYLGAPASTDSGIRSSNPYFDAWLAALICYPPFWLWFTSSGFDYKSGIEWLDHFSQSNPLYYVWGGGILALTGIYALSTVVFGLRFSNLTNRGIITHGPYRFCRHPAYISKNLSWWLIAMPFMPVLGWHNALFLSLVLLLVNSIYWVRAVTEERHLLHDKNYRRYYRTFFLGSKQRRRACHPKTSMRGFLRRYPLIIPVFLAASLLGLQGLQHDKARDFFAGLKPMDPMHAVFWSNDHERLQDTFNNALVRQLGRPALGLEDSYPLASLTKPYLASLFFDLEQQGVLSLDDAVVDWMPDFLPSDKLRESLRIHHLLSHRSGFVLAVADPLFYVNADGGKPDCPATLELISSLAQPGSKPVYMNANYCVLQVLYERVAGQPFGWGNEYGGDQSGKFAAACEAAKRLGGAGGLCLPPADLFEYLAKSVNDYLPRILSSSPSSDSNGIYANGWRVWCESDICPYLTHYGFFDGHFSSLLVVPDKGASGFVATGVMEPEKMFERVHPVLLELARKN